MAEAKECVLGEEAGVMDGAAVIGDFDQDIVFIGHVGVIDIDQRVGASGEEDVGVAWVEGELCQNGQVLDRAKIFYSCVVIESRTTRIAELSENRAYEVTSRHVRMHPCRSRGTLVRTRSRNGKSVLLLREKKKKG